MSRWPALFLLLASGAALAAQTLTASDLVWQWPESEVRRYYLETEVIMPMYMWFLAEQNKEARVSAWQIRMVVTCGDAEIERGRVWEIACTVDDVGLKAAALPGDQAGDRREPLLPPILEELDARMTGASLQFSLRNDGRVVHVDLDNLANLNRRMGQMNENLRQIAVRAVAGLDLQLPKRGTASDGIWLQHEALLMSAPNQVGNLGGSQIIHKVQDVDGARVVLTTVGKGMVAPVARGSDAPQNLYDTKLEAAAVFDTERGMLTERVWTVAGWPTASSAISEGSAGVPYYQRGRLRALAPGEAPPDVGPSEEVSNPGQAATTLHQWQSLGETTPTPLGFE